MSTAPTLMNPSNAFAAFSHSGANDLQCPHLLKNLKVKKNFIALKEYF